MLLCKFTLSCQSAANVLIVFSYIFSEKSAAANQAKQISHLLVYLQNSDSLCIAEYFIISTVAVGFNYT